MGKYVIDGRDVPAVTLNTASGRAVMALQRAVGLPLADIVQRAQDPLEQAWAAKVGEFLSEVHLGAQVTFDEVLDRPLAKFVPDADDLARAVAAGLIPADAAADPTVPGMEPEGTPGPHSEPSTATPNRQERRARASARKPSTSGAASRGSRGKSAPA